MKKTLLFLLIGCVAKTALAGDPVYPITTINADLKKNAHSVVRLSETTYRFISPKEIRKTIHLVVTILDAEGEGAASMALAYDKLNELRSMSGVRYNLLGLQDQRMRQSDIKDYAGTGDESLITDNRYKYYSFGKSSVFPYTVEWEFEYKYNTAFYTMSWFPQGSPSQAVEKAVVNIVTSPGMELKYQPQQLNQAPVTADVKEGKSYTWTLTNMPAFRKEAYALPLQERISGLYLGAKEYDYGSFHGNRDSWKDLGNFVYALNAGRDELPANVKAKVHEIADPLPNKEEKVKALYKYLQKNFRYISIQLGIGGFQTIDAATTAKTGYGDCKSLSNMMHAMLKEVGIPSHLVLADLDENPDRLPVEFPGNYFNHMIACVPNGKDTIFLECTSPLTSPGYMGSSTGNRPVLLLDSANSKLVNTPALSTADNQQISVIDAAINDTGHIVMNVAIRRTGEQQENYVSRAIYTSREHQLESLRKSFSLASYDVLNFDISANTGDIGKLPEVMEKLQIKGNNYATVQGKRMFLLPNILNATGLKLEEDSLRTSPVRIDMAYCDIDSINIKIPAGYQLEGLPKGQQLKTKFGTFEMNLTVKDKTITYIRKLEILAGTFPAADYNALVAFRNAIYKSDRSRIVFVKEQ
ncbi:DUF3857 domain-containing protein [Chitinophaga sp. Cy-1792]|uniref:DUF3857 domain-containing protein n=1 Tax=Chitinophaga sp. Cy-1792 TaxID=2608339 RepID=UPI0014237CBE|nr:DUF3857 domain-containing protein [Chitinophaga sp. Cy-1792]NIG54238.1 DUF3857 domain-containing protein [Chitinophaga sp. Cy-1792]